MHPYHNSLKMRNSPCFCLLMAAMLLLQQPVAALNWQGTGNLNNDNLTVIWAYINANFATSVNDMRIDDFNRDLSTTLNNQWAPAWNVIVVFVFAQSLAYNDVVLYGYAFKDHWMWFDGYTDQAIPSKQFSFVIWKDYNCQGWQRVGQSAGLSRFSEAQINKIVDWSNSLTNIDLIRNDPWTQAKNILDTLQADSDFVVADNHAYSIVFLQNKDESFVFGRACEVSTNHYYSALQGALAGNPGKFLLFQTR